MTNGQREMITAMRRKRLSYTTISKELGLSVNMERITRQYLCDNFDEVLERVDKEDIGFVILDEEGKDGQVLCPARWMDYCFDDDFGCIINSALRYSISRHTYMPGVVVNFIRKYINTLDTKTIDIAIEDITKAIEMNEVDDPAMWECLKEDLVARRDFLLEKANNLGKSQRQSVAQTTDKNGNDTYESTEY